MKQYDDDAEKFGYEGEMELMKCDELKEYTNPTYGSSYYDIDEVDAAIAELKEAWRSEHEACEALKQKLDEKDNDIAYWREEYDKETKLTDALNAEIESLKASHYAESVDAGMRERRLQRALWLARAELCRRLDVDRYLRKHRNSWYNENYLTWNEACVAMEVKMCKAESKCRAKAEEYK